LGKIKAIHITAMLSVMAHAAVMYEMVGVTSAGKRPMAQPSRMIYIQANLNPSVETPQPETQQQPELPVEPEPLNRPKDTNGSKTPEKIKKNKIVKHTKSAKPSSTTTQPAAPLQQASLASIVEIQQSYILQALEKIEEQKSYPMQARRRRTSGSVTLSIRVSSTGMIEKLECLQGAASLCRAAVNAAEKAQPLPALPEGTNHLAFEYQMLYKLH
jgi:TonB family protein